MPINSARPCGGGRLASRTRHSCPKSLAIPTVAYPSAAEGARASQTPVDVRCRTRRAALEFLQRQIDTQLLDIAGRQGQFDEVGHRGFYLSVPGDGRPEAA